MCIEKAKYHHHGSAKSRVARGDHLTTKPRDLKAQESNKFVLKKVQKPSRYSPETSPTRSGINEKKLASTMKKLSLNSGRAGVENILIPLVMSMPSNSMEKMKKDIKREELKYFDTQEDGYQEYAGSDEEELIGQEPPPISNRNPAPVDEFVNAAIAIKQEPEEEVEEEDPRVDDVARNIFAAATKILLHALNCR